MPLSEIIELYFNFGSSIQSTGMCFKILFGENVLHITVAALMGAIETILYEPTAWCTLITDNWIVNQLGLTIVTYYEENGGIHLIKNVRRLMTGF